MSATSFPPLVPVIDAETRSPTLMPPMLVTFPLTLVECVTAAVTVCAPPPSVIEVVRTAVTFPPIIRCSAAPDGSGAPPGGPNWVPPDGSLPEPFPAGALALGVALAAGLPDAARIAKSTTPNASAAATTAVTAKSQPCLVPRRPGGGGKPAGGYPDPDQACPAALSS